MNHLISTFINSSDILSNNLELNTKRIEFENKILYNPSVITKKDKLIFTARESNSSLVEESSVPENFNYNKLINKNYILTYSLNGDLEWAKELDDSEIKRVSGEIYYGIEDIRLFEHKNKICGIATHITIKDNLGELGYSANQVSFEIDGNTITNPYVWQSPLNKRLDKNWSPLIKEEELFFLYKIKPITVLKIENGNGKLIKGSLSNEDPQIYGGTPFVEINGNYLCVAHYPRIKNGKYYYLHSFIIVNKSFEIIEISEPFFIKRRGIEFAVGLAIYDQNLILSYGVADRAAYFSKISIHELRKHLVSI